MIKKIKRKIRLWMCKYLGWHSSIKYYSDENDPLSFLVFAECGICGYKGQIDSQGDLF